MNLLTHILEDAVACLRLGHEASRLPIPRGTIQMHRLRSAQEPVNSFWSFAIPTMFLLLKKHKRRHASIIPGIAVSNFTRPGCRALSNNSILFETQT
jgi:hypothetical protein